jgi:hypothetical protein
MRPDFPVIVSKDGHLRLDRVAIDALSETDASIWRRACELQSVTRSPYLGPDWPRRLAEVEGPDRRTGQVLVIRQGGEAVGFGSARVTGRVGLPLGAPFNDYQGLVLAPGIEVSDTALCQALGVERLDFTATPATLPGLSRAIRSREPAFAIDLTPGFEAYAQERAESGSQIVRECASRRRGLDRAHGGVRFKAASRDCRDLAQLIQWKRDQCRATGQMDVLAPDWSRALIERLVLIPDPNLKAVLFTLHVGGTLAAAHLALATPRRLHAWIIGYDASFGRYSPGNILMMEVIQWAAANGYDALDLGPGDVLFKRRFANRVSEVGSGFVARPSLSGWSGQAAFAARHLAEFLPLGPLSGLPARAMRRWDRMRALASH